MSDLTNFNALCETATQPRFEIGVGDPSRENLVADVRGIPIYGPRKAVACKVDAAFLTLAANNVKELVETVQRLLTDDLLLHNRQDEAAVALLAKIESEAKQ